MEIHLSPEQESQLAEIAGHEGKDSGQLVLETALHLLDEDTRFRAAVQEGVRQADAGNIIEEEEMDARVNRMLQS